MDNAFIYKHALNFRFDCPLMNTMWYPNITFTQCYTYYIIMTLVCVVIPANIIDFLVVLFRLNVK